MTGGTPPMPWWEQLALDLIIVGVVLVMLPYVVYYDIRGAVRGER